MNLVEIFESKKAFDQVVAERVKKTGYEVNSYYGFDHLVFGFHCELMEFANEVGFFKFWKLGHVMHTLKTLDEGVDCLHVLMSIGNMKGYERVKEVEPFALWEDYSIEDMFKLLRQNNLETVSHWTRAFELVLGLLVKLGYSELAILNQYNNKNRVNLNRQDTGY